MMRMFPVIGVLSFLTAAGCDDALTAVGPDAGRDDGAGNGYAGADSDTEIVVDKACAATFEVNATVSPDISTVAIVEWSASSDFLKAYIQFGLTTDYGYVAPVDLDEPNLRTLLLGMKPDSTYHYRFVLDDGQSSCASGDHTITTGSRPTRLPSLTVDTSDASAVSGDFIVTTTGGYAVILDGDGDYVWWYSFSGGDTLGVTDLSRAHISADGKTMWGANLNVAGGRGRLFSIGMDGQGTMETIEVDRHHDFCVLPDNSIAYIEFETDGTGKCDRIVERSESGETRVVYTIRDDFSALSTTSTGFGGSEGEWCHSNAIHYVPAEDAYYLSVLNQNMLIKVNRTLGRLIWALDGDGNTVSGVTYLTGVSWNRQHGHHTFADGRLLLFNNGEGGFGGGEGSSMALSFSLDEGAKTAVQEWSYEGGASSATLGDVQMMSNGNILVTYSNNGLMHEVSPNDQWTLIRKLTAGGFGYSDARRSLYGAPDRY